MAERVTLPLSVDTRPGAWTVLTRQEAAALLSNLDRALAWQAPALITQRCGPSVSRMRAQADATRGMLSHAESRVDQFFDPYVEGAGAGGAYTLAVDEGFPEEYPGYAAAVAQGAGLVSRFPGGVVIETAYYDTARAAVESWNTLATRGCGVSLGIPLAILAAGVTVAMFVGVVSGQIGPKAKVRWRTRWLRRR